MTRWQLFIVYGKILYISVNTRRYSSGPCRCRAHTYVLYSNRYVTYHIVWVKWACYPGETLSLTPQCTTMRINDWTFGTIIITNMFCKTRIGHMNLSRARRNPGYCSNSPFLVFFGDNVIHGMIVSYTTTTSLF